MPNHKSAKKRVRQNERRRVVNRSSRGRVKTQIKSLRAALSLGEKKQGAELLSPTVSIIDKAVNKGLLHKNTAARYKARLTRRVNSAQ
jgi:small subunit ribosomal protein S20